MQLEVIVTTRRGFQSTLPVRGATQGWQTQKNRLFRFQSTLPVRGATLYPRGANRICRYFNPRSPCGERLFGFLSGFRVYQFQSTLPVRGATDAFAFVDNMVEFQSTLPVRGATSTYVINPARMDYFNPRSPCGERLQDQEYYYKKWRFQSTLPVRGATKTVFVTSAPF